MKTVLTGLTALAAEKSSQSIEAAGGIQAIEPSANGQ